MAHANEATAVASVVLMNAFAAIPSEASALPALNPYQPTQSKPVPTMQSTMLCGAMISFLNPSLCPRKMHNTSADQPDVM
jgi:Na+/proline symporter